MNGRKELREAAAAAVGRRTPAAAGQGRRSAVRCSAVARSASSARTRSTTSTTRTSKLLMPFVPERAKILPRRISGTCALHQRKLRTAHHARAPAGADLRITRSGVRASHGSHSQSSTSTTSASAARSSRSPTATPATICCRGSWRCRRPTATSKHVERERKIVEAREARGEGPGRRRLRRGWPRIDIAIARRVGDTEQLYGSVTAADIADFLKAQGLRDRSAQADPARADQGDRRARRAAQAASRGDGAAEGAGRQGRRRTAAHRVGSRPWP